MLTRLNLDLDSGLIQLPMPALCIRLPKQHNPMTFQWDEQPFEIRSMLLSEINEGRGLSNRDKFEHSGDDRYIEKAHRRGKIGWNVGRHIEVAPHYRRPHMALVWTGQGRTVPKIVPRRGSVVHRELGGEGAERV
jgi:hypothetical protein